MDQVQTRNEYPWEVMELFLHQLYIQMLQTQSGCASPDFSGQYLKKLDRLFHIEQIFVINSLWVWRAVCEFEGFNMWVWRF